MYNIQQTCTNSKKSDTECNLYTCKKFRTDSLEHIFLRASTKQCFLYHSAIPSIIIKFFFLDILWFQIEITI